MTFGSTLAKLRKDKKWSLREVERRAELSRQTVLRAEKDDATFPVLIKLCLLYGIKLAKVQKAWSEMQVKKAKKKTKS